MSAVSRKHLLHDAGVRAQRLGKFLEMRGEEDKWLDVSYQPSPKAHPRFDEALGNGVREANTFNGSGAAPKLQSVVPAEPTHLVNQDQRAVCRHAWSQ